MKEVISSSTYLSGFSKAHRCHDILHDLDLEDSSLQMIGRLSIFINIVSNRKIGLTALKLFIIDKESILTVSIETTFFVIYINRSVVSISS